MARRRGDGPGHTRARRRAQEAAVRGLVADAVAEAKAAHAAARCDLEGSARAFLNETALPAVRALNGAVKVLPWVVEGAGGLGAGKTSGAGTRGVSLDVVIGGRTGYSNTNGGESSDNRSKVHADCGPAENPSL